jgi:hypothetical protein
VALNEGFEFWGGSIILRLGIVFFWFGVWGGLLQGCIDCWDFWAQGPGILTKSWS